MHRDPALVSEIRVVTAVRIGNDRCERMMVGVADIETGRLLMDPVDRSASSVVQTLRNGTSIVTGHSVGGRVRFGPRLVVAIDAAGIEHLDIESADRHAVKRLSDLPAY